MSELDDLIAAEATRQGLHRPGWVARHLQDALAAGASPQEIAAAVTEFRRAEPWWLTTNDSGIPVTLNEREVHGLNRPDLRERRPDGTYSPRPSKPNHDMNTGLKALLRPEPDDDANVQRLAKLVVSPPEEPPTDAQKFNEAMRTLVNGQRTTK